MLSDRGRTIRLGRLIVRGPYRGRSGYDRHVRAFTRALVRHGVQVQLIDVPEWSHETLPDDQRDPWFETLQRPVDAHVALHFTMPHQVTPIPGCRNVNFTMFEATRVPDSWVAANQTHDLLIVPTESSREAWIASGMPPERIALCPLGIDPQAFVAEQPAIDFGPDSPATGAAIRFLNVSAIGPRKNLIGLLRAWIRATEPTDDAVLILKLSEMGPGWQEVFAHQSADMLNELGKTWADAAPIVQINEILPDDVMPALFAGATHYISLSHGEGWDQPMMEAAASGLRLIAPDHSAYRAYLDERVATLLPSHEIPAQFAEDPALQAMFDGASWWEPDEAAAIAAIRAAIEGRDSPAESARERVLTRFTWDAAAERLIEILGELEPADERSRLARMISAVWRRG